MSTFLFIVLAGLLISVLAFSGAVALFLNRQRIANLLIYLVALSAGALIGGAFLHLLPEAAEEIDPLTVNAMALGAIVVFLIIEKILHWRHCHKVECDVHTFGHMSLIGDSFHNFLDGLVIAGAFIADVRLGIATTLAVALHEIPQEIGDFGVLLHAGFKAKKALILNFLVATMVLVGGIVGYALSHYIERLSAYILPIAAGGFIYIAVSDLLPEIRKEKELKRSALSFAVFMLGIGLMVLMRVLGE